MNLIKSKIEELQKLKTSTEKKTIKIKKKLNSISVRKKVNFKESQKTTMQKKASAQKLNQYLKERRKIKDNLRALRNSFNKEFSSLYLNEYFVQKNNPDNILIISLTKQSLHKISSEKTSLSKYKNKISEKENEVRTLTKEEKRHQTKIKQLTKQIKELEKEKNKIKNELKKSEQKISTLKEQAHQLSSLIQKLMSKNTSKSYKFSSDKIIWPVKGKIIKPFGLIKKNKIEFQNNGIDIAATQQSKIRAVENGKIVFCEWFNGMGNLIIIDHLNGFKTIYGHCQNILVSKGDDVLKGQIIGNVGMTGSVLEPELHFEIRKSGKPVNPLNYLEE